MKYSKRIVILIIILNVMFTTGVLAVFWHTGNEPVALVGSWFAFTGGEMFLIASIKKEKIKKGGSNEK